MGGVVPLGYRVEDRALHIVDDHAAIVRSLFRRYLEAGSVVCLKQSLDAEGATMRPRAASSPQWAAGLGLSSTTLARHIVIRPALRESADAEATSRRDNIGRAENGNAVLGVFTRFLTQGDAACASHQDEPRPLGDDSAHRTVVRRTPRLSRRGPTETARPSRRRGASRLYQPDRDYGDGGGCREGVAAGCLSCAGRSREGEGEEAEENRKKRRHDDNSDR